MRLYRIVNEQAWVLSIIQNFLYQINITIVYRFQNFVNCILTLDQSYFENFQYLILISLLFDHITHNHIFWKLCQQLLSVLYVAKFFVFFWKTSGEYLTWYGQGSSMANSCGSPTLHCLLSGNLSLFYYYLVSIIYISIYHYIYLYIWLISKSCKLSKCLFI